MQRTRRLGVLGTLVWDTIWTVDDVRRGEPFTSWGGIAYSLAGAAAARPDGWEIVPIIKVGKDLEAEARAHLATLPGFSVGPSVMPVDVPNNRVELRYTDGANRGERQSGGIPGWEWHELEPHLAGLDALFVNFISGAELSLETAERLRDAFPSPLYTDLHSLFLGPPGEHQRAYRRLPDWERWMSCFDGVQLNEDELAMLAAAGESADETMRRMLARGPSLIALTMGARGAAYVAHTSAADVHAWPVRRQGRGRASTVSDSGPSVKSAFRGGVVPPREPSATGDPTGAGDVWGVTLFSTLLAGLPLEDAMRAAHAAAGRKLHHRGASDLYAHLAATDRDSDP
ncbi:MAG: hypothetical protein JWM27_2150 [Gemmatimonadetes bacterium]|nr:hypothetical protein [Gemmatimonadota bacterium]